MPHSTQTASTTSSFLTASFFRLRRTRKKVPDNKSKPNSKSASCTHTHTHTVFRGHHFSVSVFAPCIIGWWCRWWLRRRRWRRVWNNDPVGRCRCRMNACVTVSSRRPRHAHYASVCPLLLTIVTHSCRLLTGNDIVVIVNMRTISYDRPRLCSTERDHSLSVIILPHLLSHLNSFKEQF